MYILFTVSAFILLICYFGYPAFFYLIYKLTGDKTRKDSGFTPTVAVITSFYNEEKSVVEGTFNNRLGLGYPKNKIKLVFVVDGSSSSIKSKIDVSRENIMVYETEQHGGKTNALNKVIPMLDSEILVFSDANSIYRPESIRMLIRNFADPKVGGVCGELQYIDEKLPDMTGQLSKTYFKYEQFVKTAESRVSTLTVFNGAIYAIRRELHQEMNPQAANDFQHPLQIILQGYKSVYEPEAVAYEKTVKNDLVEFKRTVRITSRGWKGFFTYREVINPLRTKLFSLQFLFRKLLRWLSPVFMIVILISSFLLRENIYLNIIFIMQLLFYLTAFGGWVLREKGFLKILYYPYYFCLVNLAALVGFIFFIFGRDSATWIPSINNSR